MHVYLYQYIGRHFLSVSKIHHIINGMAMLKLNVLHWHITDSTAFPVKVGFSNHVDPLPDEHLAHAGALLA